MKFLLMLHNNPVALDALDDAGRKALEDGHNQFIKATQESGELVVTQALSDPSTSAVVRVRNGRPAVTDGPYLESKEFLGGFYMIDVPDRERALELAARIPDASIDGMGVEVRQVMFEAGLDL
ncbi:YciI family protein [Nocardia alni]|uniref:YciI family protein n=1 Tax=Nocardia alni TaxID=2815723 RepID=UPI001C229030|nr:YciI family protein [Nocardia alni]